MVPAARVSELSLVVLDTETTGLGEAYMVEVAAVRVQPSAGERTFHSLVKPPCRIPPMATAVHGISDAMVREAPPAGQVLPRFLRFCAGGLVLAHNAPFDLKVLAAELFRAGLPLPRTGFLDTLRLSRRAFPEITSHTLEHLARVHGLDGAGAHRALADARVTLQVLRRCLERMGGQELTLGGLLARHGAPYTFDRAIAASRVIHGPVGRSKWALTCHSKEANS